MIEFALANKKGAAMLAYTISEPLQRELDKHFNAEACRAIVNLITEMTERNAGEQFKKIFEEHQEYLIATIIQRMHSIFATKKELDSAIEVLKSQMEAEFAKLRQEMAELRLELKQEIADVRQEIADVRQEITDVKSELKQEIMRLDNKIEKYGKEVRYYAIGIIVLMFLLQPKVFDFITGILK